MDVGLDESLVLCVIDAGNTRSIALTAKQWQRNYFPFWSTRKIGRILLRMEKVGLLESSQPEGVESRRKHYVLTDLSRDLLEERVSQ